MKDINSILQAIFPESLTSKALCILYKFGVGVPFNLEGSEVIIKKVKEVKDDNLRDVLLIIVGMTITLQIMQINKDNQSFTYADFFQPLCDQ